MRILGLVLLRPSGLTVVGYQKHSVRGSRYVLGYSTEDRPAHHWQDMCQSSSQWRSPMLRFRSAAFDQETR
ncbi:hypothetical protein IF2G_08731 [Cordyceps javanica]|nr:hypothetical protein IF2G_08731 [Cordyceps javanica]